jgi:FtsZ-binding cell division protein ZapB
MSDAVVERLGQLEEAVRRAADMLGRLREENDRLREENDRIRRDVTRLTEERRQILGQIDGILDEIAKLEIQ